MALGDRLKEWQGIWALAVAVAAVLAAWFAAQARVDGVERRLAEVERRPYAQAVTLVNQCIALSTQTAQGYPYGGGSELAMQRLGCDHLIRSDAN